MQLVDLCPYKSQTTTSEQAQPSEVQYNNNIKLKQYFLCKNLLLIAIKNVFAYVFVVINNKIKIFIKNNVLRQNKGFLQINV